jgi:biotin transport system substrate-specific component
MAVYLAFGAAGLPIFAPTGVPGFARLLGPTGGYLLAYPLAAALVGALVHRRNTWPVIAVALVGGLAVIHAGGIGQLAILSGDVRTAVALGSAPFLLLDVVKLLFAGLIVRRFGTRTRALV